MRRLLALGAAAALLAAGATAAATLDDVKTSGSLKCGVNTGLAGFSATDASGRWTGFDVALCRAVAAAVLGDGEKVDFVPTTAEIRFTAFKYRTTRLVRARVTYVAADRMVERATNVPYYTVMVEADAASLDAAGKRAAAHR